MPAGSPAGPNGAPLPAIALADALGMCPLQAPCHCGLGMLYAATSEQEQAWAERSATVDLSPAMAMTFWLPETELALAQVERAHGL